MAGALSGFNWGNALGALGGALQTFGAPPDQRAQVGAALSQNFNNMLEDQRRRKERDFLLNLEISDRARANQEREEAKRKQEEMESAYRGLLTGQQPPSGFSQSQFGGAPTGGGALGQLSPEQRQFLQAAGPQAGLGVLGQRLFPSEEQRKGVNIGGVLVDPVTGQQIADYSDVIRQNAMAGRSITNVQTNMGPSGIDYGKPPEGLVWQRGPNNEVIIDDRGAPIAIPFQGGPAWVKQQQSEAEAMAGAEKAAATQASKQQTADIVTEDIDRAIKLLDEAKTPITGFFGGMLSGVGGTAANDVRALVETVKANVGFDKLQAMRAASPTGGALGQVSDFENRNLQAVIGNLEQSQTEEQFRENLKRVKDVYLDIIHGPGNRPSAQPNTTQKRLKYNPATGELE